MPPSGAQRVAPRACQRYTLITPTIGLAASPLAFFPATATGAGLLSLSHKPPLSRPQHPCCPGRGCKPNARREPLRGRQVPCFAEPEARFRDSAGCLARRVWRPLLPAPRHSRGLLFPPPTVPEPCRGCLNHHMSTPITSVCVVRGGCLGNGGFTPRVLQPPPARPPNPLTRPRRRDHKHSLRPPPGFPLPAGAPLACRAPRLPPALGPSPFLSIARCRHRPGQLEPLSRPAALPP